MIKEQHKQIISELGIATCSTPKGQEIVIDKITEWKLVFPKGAVIAANFNATKGDISFKLPTINDNL